MAEIWTIRSYLQAFALLCVYYVSVTCTLIPDDVKEEIVAVHNSLRRNFARGSEGATVANMKKLVWNNDLERRAKRKLRLHCKLSFFAILDNDTCSNLASDSNGHLVNDIQTWYSEIEHNFYPDFEPNRGICFPEHNCRHATAMLNADARYIGCAYRRRCDRRKRAFFCLYENDVEHHNEFQQWGQFYKSGAECTKCSNTTSFCEDSLCVSCDTNPELCQCRKTCSGRGVGLGVLNRESCTCTCQFGMGENCDEPCENPASDMFYDYDICETVDTSMCADNPMLYTSCPTVCGGCVPFAAG